MTLHGGTEQRLGSPLLRESQSFDLVREMDKVPEDVSPDIPKWNALTNHKNNKHQNTPMHDKLDGQRTDRGWTTDLGQEQANNNTKVLHKPLLALFRQLVPRGFQERVLAEETQIRLQPRVLKTNFRFCQPDIGFDNYIRVQRKDLGLKISFMQWDPQ